MHPLHRVMHKSVHVDEYNSRVRHFVASPNPFYFLLLQLYTSNFWQTHIFATRLPVTFFFFFGSEAGGSASTLGVCQELCAC
jgi:hypothetical protein